MEIQKLVITSKQSVCKKIQLEILKNEKSLVSSLDIYNF